HLGGEGGIVGGQLPGRVQVVPGGLQFAVGGHDRRQFGESLADPAGGRRIVVQRRIGQLGLQSRVLGQDVVDRGRLRHVRFLFLGVGLTDVRLRGGGWGEKHRRPGLRRRSGRRRGSYLASSAFLPARLP